MKDRESNTALWLEGVRTTVLEIKNAVVVGVASLKHHDLCERLAESNYFYTEEKITCTNFRICVMLFVYTLHARSYLCT